MQRNDAEKCVATSRRQHLPLQCGHRAISLRQSRSLAAVADRSCLGARMTFRSASSPYRGAQVCRRKSRAVDQIRLLRISNGMLHSSFLVEGEAPQKCKLDRRATSLPGDGKRRWHPLRHRLSSGERCQPRSKLLDGAAGSNGRDRLRPAQYSKMSTATGGRNANANRNEWRRIHGDNRRLGFGKSLSRSGPLSPSSAPRLGLYTKASSSDLAAKWPARAIIWPMSDCRTIRYSTE